MELSNFYKQRATSAEQVKVLNFFLEVSRDIDRYRVGVGDNGTATSEV